MNPETITIISGNLFMIGLFFSAMIWFLGFLLMLVSFLLFTGGREPLYVFFCSLIWPFVLIWWFFITDQDRLERF